MGKPPIRADFRQRLSENQHLDGCFVKLSGLEILDALQAAGADFSVLDLEHSTIDDREAFAQVAYSRALGLPCFVRLSVVEPGAIGRFLDAGATGIQLSDVASGEEARVLVRAARYAPMGDRGMSPSQRDGGYGRAGIRELQAGAAGEPVLVAQVERELPAAELAAIAASGVDVLFVGHADLAVRLSVRDDEETTRRLAQVTEAVALAAADAGIAFGQHGGAPGLLHNGAMFLTRASDTVVLASALRSVFEGTR